MGYVNFSEGEIRMMASNMYSYNRKYHACMSPDQKYNYNNILSKLGSPKSNGSPWDGHYPYIYGDLSKRLHQNTFASLEAYQEAVKIGTNYDGDKMADYCWFVETEVPPYHEEVVYAV